MVIRSLGGYIIALTPFHLKKLDQLFPVFLVESRTHSLKRSSKTVVEPLIP